MSTEHISELHAAIAGSSVFRTDGPTIDLPAALIALAQAVHDYDGETESMWGTIGEHTECPLGDLLVGAYWALTEWHGGQSSDTYAAMCAVGRVFNPGCCDGPEPDSGEESVYQMINAYFDALYNTPVAMPEDVNLAAPNQQKNGFILRPYSQS
jgi:hypothetical protein